VDATVHHISYESVEHTGIVRAQNAGMILPIKEMTICTLTLESPRLFRKGTND